MNKEMTVNGKKYKINYWEKGKVAIPIWQMMG